MRGLKPPLLGSLSGEPLRPGLIDDLVAGGDVRLLPAQHGAGIEHKFALTADGRGRAQELAEQLATEPLRAPTENPDAPSIGSVQASLAGSARQDPEGDTRPKAFISWAHGGEEWERTVLDFATALRRTGGVDADLDLWHFTDHENWTTYGPKAIADSNFILVAFDPAYKLRWEGDEEPYKGAGAAREAAAIKAIFERDRDEFVRRVKPVVLPGAANEDIPNDVYGVAERFVVKAFDEKGLEGLLRSIFGKPYDPKPPLGPLPGLPPRFVDEIQQAPPPTDRQGTAADAQSDAIKADEPASDEASLAARLEQIDNALKSYRPEDKSGNMALQPNRHWDQLVRERAQVSAALDALQRSEAGVTGAEPGTASGPKNRSSSDHAKATLATRTGRRTSIPASRAARIPILGPVWRRRLTKAGNPSARL